MAAEAFSLERDPLPRHQGCHTFELVPGLAGLVPWEEGRGESGWQCLHHNPVLLRRRFSVLRVLEASQATGNGAGTAASAQSRPR